MGKKVKWALLTMLGFATACSTVKNAPQGGPQDQAPDSARVERQIRLMYGVPVREFQARPLADSARGEGRLPSAEAQPEDVPAK